MNLYGFRILQDCEWTYLLESDKSVISQSHSIAILYQKFWQKKNGCYKFSFPNLKYCIFLRLIRCKIYPYGNKQVS